MVPHLWLSWLALTSGCSADPENDGTIRLESAFPHLRFERPVYITELPDRSGRLVIVEQHGVIHLVRNQADVRKTKIFLDISARVSRRGNEEGLIGLAFHPHFEKNGSVFIHYSSRRRREGIVSRFRIDPENPDSLRNGSEEVLLRVSQPYRNHNGGMLEFGPDGFLYISFGDGGAAGDPQRNGQNPGTWLGSILRIDVDRSDSGRPYAIPPDNPFRDRADGALPEVWAYGLRNVWRFSFDRKGGALWAGDVGQDKWEEVDVIIRGGNYGWRAYEGHSRYSRRTTPRGRVIPPVAVYGRREGVSITGGYVYRGQSIPALVGRYVYADFESGKLWSIDARSRSEKSIRLHLDSGPNIASFGEDREGELYACAFDGRIYRLVAGQDD